MPKISARAQLLFSLLALVFACAGMVARFYSYVEKGISIDKLYTPLVLWVVAFIDFAFIIYLGYLKEVLKKHIPFYKTIVYTALAILALCIVWAMVLEYTLRRY